MLIYGIKLPLNTNNGPTILGWLQYMFKYAQYCPWIEVDDKRFHEQKRFQSYKKLIYFGCDRQRGIMVFYPHVNPFVYSVRSKFSALQNDF